MSCEVCKGYAGVDCPVCGSHETCPDCKGHGEIYYAFDIHARTFTRCNDITYLLLPESEDEAYMHNKRYCQGEVVMCKRCLGEGKIKDSSAGC